MLLNRCLDGNNRSIISIRHIFLSIPVPVSNPIKFLPNVYCQRSQSLVRRSTQAQHFYDLKKFKEKKSWIEPPVDGITSGNRKEEIWIKKQIARVSPTKQTPHNSILLLSIVNCL